MKVYVLKWESDLGHAYYLRGPGEEFVDLIEAEVYLSEKDAIEACRDPESGQYLIEEYDV